MKKMIFIFSLIGLCMLSISCSKSKNDNPSNGNTNLINKWNLIKGTFKDSITGEIDNEDVTEGSYLRFDANGICYSMNDGESDAGDWYFIDNNSGVFIESIANSDLNNINYTIITLTDHSLVLKTKNLIGVEGTLTLSK